MKKRLLTVILAASWAAPAAAQVPAGDPTVHRHLGFFLHLDLGLGALASSASTPIGDVKLSGGGGNFSIAAGGAVAENFILAGHIWDHVVSDPKVEVGGISGTATNSTLGLVGYGLNLTYYFRPSNLYLSATPSVTVLTVKSGGQSYDTEAGFGVQLAVGKEWWVSDHWGLGLNGQLAVASNKDKGAGAPTWGSAAIAIAFSATYN